MDRLITEVAKIIAAQWGEDEPKQEHLKTAHELAHWGYLTDPKSDPQENAAPGAEARIHKIDWDSEGWYDGGILPSRPSNRLVTLKVGLEASDLKGIDPERPILITQEPTND